jgi:hypothetical protein
MQAWISMEIELKTAIRSERRYPLGERPAPTPMCFTDPKEIPLALCFSPAPENPPKALALAKLSSSERSWQYTTLTTYYDKTNGINKKVSSGIVA